VWVHVLLLLLTVASTTFVGGCHYLSFDQAFDPAPPLNEQDGRAFILNIFTQPSFYLNGLWYSLTVLGILGCHEMGHYVACLRYGVDASRPYFLPAPLLLTGTLGAFIRIRSRIPSKAALFDIGIAGPIAGFVIAVPALFAGLAMSEVVRLPADQSELMSLGEPLLFRFAAWLIFGDVAEGYSINMHPMAFAAWFGLLATALNLFPIAQLDGGHVSYAVLGRRSLWITLAMVAAAVGLTFVSTSWIAWTVMLLLMLVLVGPRHPPTLDDETPLDGTRLWLALVALLMLIVCFTPAPIEPFVTGGQ
jgi:membrane-associated protease RseP (regulator of RpoE activity)